MPPKHPPEEEVLFAFEIRRVNGHHEQFSQASPKARFWIAVGVIVVLGNAGIGLAEKVASVAALVSQLTGRVP